MQRFSGLQWGFLFLNDSKSLDFFSKQIKIFGIVFFVGKTLSYGQLDMVPFASLEPPSVNGLVLRMAFQRLH